MHVLNGFKRFRDGCSMQAIRFKCITVLSDIEARRLLATHLHLLSKSG
jgi:hypothetical protein